MKATLFADGGSRGNPGPAASGAVLYAEDGGLLEEVALGLGIATNNVAEWRALVIGLEAALRHGIDTIVVRMDSELVVKQMNGLYRVKHPDLVPLHREALRARARFASFEIGHVRRAQNAAADAVVNRVLDAAAAGRAAG